MHFFEILTFTKVASASGNTSSHASTTGPLHSGSRIRFSLSRGGNVTTRPASLNLGAGVSLPDSIFTAERECQPARRSLTTGLESHDNYRQARMSLFTSGPDSHYGWRPQRASAAGVRRGLSLLDLTPTTAYGHPLYTYSHYHHGVNRLFQSTARGRTRLLF